MVWLSGLFFGYFLFGFGGFGLLVQSVSFFLLFYWLIWLGGLFGSFVFWLSGWFVSSSVSWFGEMKGWFFGRFCGFVCLLIWFFGFLV